MSRVHENYKNITRERLKMKLKKTYNDKYKVMKTENSSSVTPQAETSAAKEDSRNIRDLLNFIEGKTVQNSSYEKETYSFEQYEKIKREESEKAQQVAEENEKLLNVQKRLSKKIRRLERQMQTEIAKEKERQHQEALRMAELERKINEIKLIEEENRIKLEHQESKKKKKKDKSKQKSDKPDPVYNKTINSKQVQYLADIVSQNNENTGQMVTIKRVKCTSNETTVNITMQGSVSSEDEVLYTFVNGEADSDGGVTIEEVNTSNSDRQSTSPSSPNFPYTYQPYPGTSNSPIPCPAPTPPQTKTPAKQFKKAVRTQNTSQDKDKKLNLDLATNTNIFGSIQLSPEITVTRVVEKPEIHKPAIDPADITITKIDSPTRNSQINEYSPPNLPTSTPKQSRVYILESSKTKQILSGSGSKKEDKRKQKFKLIKGG